jgi:ABC-type multidrug transport system ATPase subunit
MLSTGSRRKALMAAGLASGAAIVCLDQPFAALDAPSTRALQRALREDADDGRVIVLADFEVPADLAVDSALTLPPP